MNLSNGKFVVDSYVDLALTDTGMRISGTGDNPQHTPTFMEGLNLKLQNWYSPIKVKATCFSLLLAATTYGVSLAADQATTLPIPQAPEIPQTPEMIEKVLQLETDAQKLMEKGELDKALVKVQEAYGIALEMKFTDGQGRALTQMCEIYLARNQASKAKELGENAIEVLSTSGNTKALSQARVALAQAYFALDNPSWAATQLDLALKSFTQFGLNDSSEAARVMLISGNVLFKMGKLKEAIQFFQGSATYSEQSGNHLQSIATRIKLASVMRELGWFVAALEEAQKAAEEARQCKDQSLYPAALAGVAVAQYNLGEFANARRSYEDLLFLRSNNDLAIARLEAGYGHTLAATGDLDAAAIELENGLKIVQTKGTPLEQAQIVNTLGCIEELKGHHARAAQLVTRALEMISLVEPKQDRFNLLMLHNLAAIESRSGDMRNAKGHLLGCFPILKKLGDKMLEGRTYASLGEICLALQDPQEAEKYLRAGIIVSEKVNDDAALWRDYTNLASLQLSMNQVAPARESLNSALSYFRSPQAGWFAAPEQLGFCSSREDLGSQLVAFLVAQGQLEPALLAAEQLKEESFINEWHRRGGEVKPADREVYNDLVNARAHLHTAESVSTPDKLLKDWQNWLTRYKQLASSNRSLARLIAPVPSSLSEIVKGIESNHAVAVDYLVGPHSTIVFTLDNSGRLAASKLAVGRVELQGQVASLLPNTGRPDAQAERRTLRQLYSELLPEPVRAVLPTNADQTVVILPDGVLFNLPFAALVDQSGKYLVETHTLTMASSMGVFLDSPPPYSHDLSLVVAGDENKEADEGNQISSLFQPDLVTKLVGKDAEINNLQEQVKGRSVLHFASKMPLADGNPARAVLPILASKEESKDKVLKITADRLFGLNLSSDLVVWSGTQVNSTDLQGSAVKLFSRGLNYAGVRNVIMSLWIEPDAQRTSQLVDFYKGEQKGLNQAQSLRKAQLLSLSKDPSPHSWAAFQLLGPGY